LAEQSGYENLAKIPRPSCQQNLHSLLSLLLRGGIFYLVPGHDDVGSLEPAAWEPLTSGVGGIVAHVA
jgi:hypothetical protein